MLVIPAVNASSRDEAFKAIRLAANFARWIHIDVTRGDFSKAVIWGDPGELFQIAKELDGIKFEAHLMVNEPEQILEDWLKAGVSRVILHEETISDFKNIFSLCEKYGAEPMLSVRLDHSKPAKKLSLFKAFQVLAVKPGFAGQEFDERALGKIRLLREASPGAKIEVDGGINPVTARKAKAAGADILVSASYIFGSENPREAHGKLESA